MKLPRWMPGPAAWASAVALYVFAAGVREMFTLLLPLVMALMRHSARLAWLGMLLLWLSPIALAAAVHDFVGRHLGVRARGPREPLLGATSWWAGLVAWTTILVVTMTTAFVVLVINPPPIVVPDSVWNLAARVTETVTGTTWSSLWIVLAAYVYELELRARRAPTD